MESRWLWSGTKISNFLKELNEKDAIFVKNSETTLTYSFIRYDDYGNEAKPYIVTGKQIGRAHV